MKIRRVTSKLEDVVAEGHIQYGARTTNAGAVFECLRPLIGDESVEVFVVLLLDGKHRVNGYSEISRGTLTASLVHPREVFGPALRMGAAAIIVAHNHPSGDPTPSSEDLAVTERLTLAGNIVGVPLLDHVVIGGESFVSIRNTDPSKLKGVQP